MGEDTIDHIVKFLEREVAIKKRSPWRMDRWVVQHKGELSILHSELMILLN